MQQSQTSDQQALWNGPAGHAWVDQQALTDTAFRPIEAWQTEAVLRSGARTVLDVGCGTGSTTLAIARRLAPGGHCLGVDISAPMIERACARAAGESVPADFARGDAQTHAFPPGAYDLVVSRFGTMFFADPVAAFANLHRAARPGGGRGLIVWRGPEQNDFMTAAERAAAPLLSELPPRSRDGPGQFAFADPDRVRSILERGGWSGIAIEPADFECAIPAAALVDYVANLGPVGLALREADPEQRSRVVATVLPAFDRYVAGDEVRFTAACWAVKAKRPE